MKIHFWHTYEKHATLLLAIVAAVFFIAAVIGAVYHYSPVPYWDMWDGYLNFYIEAIDGNKSAWWAQHNEHRIVLTRFLFWLDLTFFHGTMIFLLLINFLLVTMSIITYFVILKAALPHRENLSLRLGFIFFISILLFSVMQQDNLYESFQAQFFLACLLPLVSLYLLYLAYQRQERYSVLYLVSIICGTACVGTMANGVLVLPIMALLAIILRMEWHKIFELVVLSSIFLYLYFHDYQAPSHHGSLIYEITHHPIQLLQYILIYLGSPFYYITEFLSSQIGLFGAQVAGLFFLGSTLFFSYKSLQNPQKNALQWILLGYVFYIIATAIATAGGRLLFGLDQARTGRYTTVSLMGWSAQLILYVIFLSQKKISFHRFFTLLLVITFLLFIPQKSAFKDQSSHNLNKLIAALALEMNINDKTQINFVYPSMERAQSVSQASSERHLSIFSHPLINNIRQKMGGKNLAKSTIPCLGTINEMNSIENAPRYQRIQGWLYEPLSQKAPLSLFIVNHHNKIVGYAITGSHQPHIKSTTHHKVNHARFKGYILTESAHDISLFKEIIRIASCISPSLHLRAPLGIGLSLGGTAIDMYEFLSFVYAHSIT